jgi:hypothetical protein
MNTKNIRLVVVGLGLAFAACGGQQLGGVDGGEGGAGSSGSTGHGGSAGGSGAGGSSGADSGNDSGNPEASPADAPASCMQNPGSGGVDASPMGCGREFSETCSDGTTYRAFCECPAEPPGSAGTCSCSTSSGQTKSVAWNQCTTPCTGLPPNADEAWMACGYPTSSLP